jgi:hypothetical protein
MIAHSTYVCLDQTQDGSWTVSWSQGFTFCAHLEKRMQNEIFNILFNLKQGASYVTKQQADATTLYAQRWLAAAFVWVCLA